MKAILIARVSTEEQREAGNSLPAQVARLERYCQNNGIQIMKTCSFDESAYSTNRSEFDSIIDFVLNQKEKVIVCCDKVDRLSRNIFDKRISQLYEKALCDQIELHFISDGQIINSRISAVEKFQFGISLGLAKYYSDAISDNVRRAQEQKIRKGEWLSKAPYGYKNVKMGDKKDVVVNEFEAHIVRKAFELYATGVYSLAAMCQKLKDEHGLNWRVSFLDKMYNNPFYYGMMRIKEKLYPHRYPPLISKTLFDQVQKVKRRLNKKYSRYAGHPYIYRGLFRCAQCGLAITPEKHKGLVYYHCTEYKGKHGAKWLREERITEEMEKVFKEIQLTKEEHEQLITSLHTLHEAKSDFKNKEVEKLTREHTRVSNMMDNLYLERLDRSITESEYDKFYQKLKDRKTDIALRLEQLHEADESYYITARYMVTLCSEAYDLFLTSEIEEKRLLIKFVLSNLLVDDGKVVYEAHKPFNYLLERGDCTLWRP